MPQLYDNIEEILSEDLQKNMDSGLYRALREISTIIYTTKTKSSVWAAMSKDG
ncbi:MAG: hypothetical protein U9P44_02070 [archaeon]|nr:hypothetical protein [archaeon]